MSAQPARGVVRDREMSAARTSRAEMICDVRREV